jgi:hypothetical protein
VEQKDQNMPEQIGPEAIYLNDSHCLANSFSIESIDAANRFLAFCQKWMAMERDAFDWAKGLIENLALVEKAKKRALRARSLVKLGSRLPSENAEDSVPRQASF